MLERLPCLHFLVETERGGSAGLVSPAELAAHESAGASYFVPVNDEGSLFPAYRFDFSLYRGQGQFLKPENGKPIFDGMAFSAIDQKREVLFCTFEYPFGAPGTNGHSHMPLWFFERRPVGISPLFHRVQPKKHSKCLTYFGNYKHKDFKLRFAEIEPVEQSALDELLEQRGLSIVGCSPALRYTLPKRKLMRA